MRTNSNFVALENPDQQPGIQQTVEHRPGVTITRRKTY